MFILFIFLWLSFGLSSLVPPKKNSITKMNRTKHLSFVNYKRFFVCFFDDFLPNQQKKKTWQKVTGWIKIKEQTLKVHGTENNLWGIKQKYKTISWQPGNLLLTFSTVYSTSLLFSSNLLNNISLLYYSFKMEIQVQKQ